MSEYKLSKLYRLYMSAYGRKEIVDMEISKLIGEGLSREEAINRLYERDIGFVERQQYEEAEKAIPWQEGESCLAYRVCSMCREAYRDQLLNGLLVVTNQRLLFLHKPWLTKNYVVAYMANLEDIVSISHEEYPLLEDKLTVLNRNIGYMEFHAENIRSLAPVINQAMAGRKSQLEAKRLSERVQIVLDFSSLKDIIAKGGIVISTFNCPNCNATLEIPETGRIIFCKYCGTPLKPIDIFERIKSLLRENLSTP